MSVPDHQVIQYHVESCFENGLISLPLPELDVEAAFVMADPSVRFSYVSHIISHQGPTPAKTKTVWLITRDAPRWLVTSPLIAPQVLDTPNIRYSFTTAGIIAWHVGQVKRGRKKAVSFDFAQDKSRISCPSDAAGFPLRFKLVGWLDPPEADKSATPAAGKLRVWRRDSHGGL